ncbi:MAG: helix-turn-helix domain-containing protein [Woeseiaceae bacterium]
MQSEDVIAAFNRAWSERDVAGILRLLTPDCLHFDAYFGDLVPGWNLAEYLKNDIDRAIMDYTVTDITECTPEVACYRYAARILDSNGNVLDAYDGAERLCLRAGKIYRMTDWYVAPGKLLDIYYGPGIKSIDPAGTRGSSEYAIREILQCRSKLMRALRLECGYSNPDVSLPDVARQIKHSEQLILLVLDIAFNRNFDDFVEKCRVDCAREMISQQVLSGHLSTDLSVDKRIALRVGFKSHGSFVEAFKKRFAETPRQCRREFRRCQAIKREAA